VLEYDRQQEFDLAQQAKLACSDPRWHAIHWLRKKARRLDDNSAFDQSKPKQKQEKDS